MSERTPTGSGPVEGVVRRTARIRGVVQGVGFRMATASRAQRLGFAGTVRNLVDGSVEAVLEGPASAVDEMLSWLREGPSSADVESVTVSEATPQGASMFEIR